MKSPPSGGEAPSSRRSTYRDLLERMLSGEKLALAKLVTFIENDDPAVPEIMERIYPKTGRCYSFGVTGPPGAGKSTLVDKLIARFRDRGQTVGVIAVDPSSPFSGGAVLGDRIRMQRHALDDGVFIRSLGTRGTGGGLSRATGEVLRLFDAFGLDVVVIETVGVGQTELDIMDIADSTVVVLVPESGDTVQTMKAGLMEIADLFVVNKADRPGAEKLASELKAMIEMNRYGRKEWKAPVLLCQANEDRGIDEVYEQLLRHKAHLAEATDPSRKKVQVRRRHFMEILGHRFAKRLEALAREDETFQGYLKMVEEEEANPYRITKLLLQDPSFAEKLFSMSPQDGQGGGP